VDIRLLLLTHLPVQTPLRDKVWSGMEHTVHPRVTCAVCTNRRISLSDNGHNPCRTLPSKPRSGEVRPHRVY